MNEEIKKQLDLQGERIEEIYKSVEKTRKYFLAIIWISVIAFVLPLFAMVFVAPAFLSNYSSALNGDF
jgi:hypothetical protein